MRQPVLVRLKPNTDGQTRKAIAIMDYRDSEILQKLVLEKLDARRAGTRSASGIGDGANARKSARRHQPAGPGGTNQPMGMLMGKRARLIRHSPFLMIIDGGKA